MRHQTTRTWGLACLACGLAFGAATARGQVVERRQTQTGPGGRSIERSIRTERGPGYIERRVDVNRSSGASASRTTVMRTGPGGRPMGGPPPPRPRYGPGPAFGPAFGPAVGLGMVAAPFLSLSIGSPPPPPPPPVVVVPEPIYAYPAPPVVIAAPPPPVVIAAPAPRYVVEAEPPQPPPVADPWADALGRLKSFHANSRRDGSLALGHFGDDRAVPALMERLERDGDRDVRVAAAWALGEIGDPRSAVALERAALYDKKHEVRDAANEAYRRLPRPGQPRQEYVEQAPPQGQARIDDPGPSASPNRPASVPDNGYPDAPALEGPAGSTGQGRPS
ncbi:HEAT repeat domain-containing protein [Tundrisphaera sp. TA3]|uniref:HEAT repeat domain-containing protein n=1 Tax=Tundrisphaera sp. TA3 TaxID=3435775 RepID=UPI003EBBD4D3